MRIPVDELAVLDRARDLLLLLDQFSDVCFILLLVNETSTLLFVDSKLWAMVIGNTELHHVH